MGKSSRDKGSRIERELAAKISDAGIPTRRVIGRGAHGGIDDRLRGDLQIGVLDGGHWLLTGEVKARKDGAGFVQLERWLGDNDLLLLKRNNAAPMAVLPWNTFQALLYAFYKDETADYGDKEVSDGNNIDRGGDMSGDEHLHGGKK